jgi:hypothetical protein
LEATAPIGSEKKIEETNPGRDEDDITWFEGRDEHPD